MEVKEVGKKIIFIEGKDRYATESRIRAAEVFNLWLLGNRLPKTQMKLKSGKEDIFTNIILQ